MALVDVHELRKVYDGRPVVDSVTFEVEEGEIFGILGPNGAGKTTTVESIEGLRAPDAGSIRVMGHDPRSDGGALRRVLGAQLQQSRLPDRLRVWEALDLYGSFYEQPADPDHLLGMLGLQDQRSTTFRQLSGGQQQRLSIALALIGQPRVAVLDELTTGLDPQARRDTWALIEAIRDRGVTILLVTHFMEEAERLCDRLALIDSGRVVTVDTPARIIEHGGQEEVLRFIPSRGLDLDDLLAVPAVTDVRRERQEVVVVGTPGVVQAALTHLSRHDVRADELRVEQPDLDDAFVAMTGRTLQDDDHEEVDR